MRGPRQEDLRGRADAIFAAESPYPGAGLRNHCLRLYHFADLLLERAGLDLDRDVLYLAAMLHDLGLVTEQEQDRGADYLQRSRALFLRSLPSFDPELDQRTIEIVEECLLYNHRLRPVHGVSPVAECFRQAVWIEHSRGLLRFGLPRRELGSIFATHPRADFDRVLIDFAWRVLRREPRTLWRGIFL